MLVTSLLRGLELATGVVNVVEVLLEVFLEECVVNRKAWWLHVTQGDLGIHFLA